MSPELSLASRVRTRQGLELPRLGFGTFQTPAGSVTRKAVGWALAAGYRLIDTAAMYGNEADVGEAVRASGVPREEIVVTTKLWFTEHGFEPAQAAARASYERLGLGPIDLYLIHWPRAESPEARLGSWKALEKLQREGLLRTIGVSNYTVRHLEELRARAEVAPSVDQVEMHPWVYDPALAAYAAEHRLVLEAYSPLTRAHRLDDPTVAGIARAHGKSPAQVLLRWGLQRDLVELPKSTREERIRENADLYGFALAAPEMAALDALRNGGRVGKMDPESLP